MMVELPYGHTPYPLDLTGRDSRVLRAPEMPIPRPLDELLGEALARPFGHSRLDSIAAPARRITIIVSDATRDEPRARFLAALEPHLPTQATYTLAIATGTHGPSDLEPLGLPDAWLRRATLINHDGHRREDLVDLGTTSRGTPIRLHRCLLEADLVIATGCIRPHYFAGFGAGAKAIFPGLGDAEAIRTNHAHKTHPRARAGIVDDNPCRIDLEEVVAALATPTFLLDAVAGPDDRIHAAVAGDPNLAFREGAELARPWFTVSSPPASLVIASDALPVTGSLYQAAKIAAAVAPIVAPGGTLVVVAECLQGIEPLAVVNEAIFRIGVLPRLASGVRLALVSSLSRDLVDQTLLSFAESLEDLVQTASTITVVPRASQLIVRAS